MSKKIAMIFPGQGSQKIGMGRDFFEKSEVAREMFAKAGERINVNFEKLLFEENDTINQTEYTQPAILLVSMVAYKLFSEQYKGEVELFLGHSLGEISALCASGAIDYIDAVELVHKRGKLMSEACADIEAGMMALVGIADDAVESVCEKAQAEGKKVYPANYNQDGQIVVAGIKSDLVAMEESFKEAGAKKTVLLNMSVASHCPLLASAQAELKAELEAKVSDTFSAEIISNVTTKGYKTKAEAVELLTEQLVKPVKYKQSILAIAERVDTMIEFGQGVVLKGLNRRIVKDIPTLNVSDMASLEKVLGALNS